MKDLIPLRIPAARQDGCTACTQPLTAIVIFGTSRVVLCCDGCGRQAVHCECKPPEWHPWAK